MSQLLLKGHIPRYMLILVVHRRPGHTWTCLERKFHAAMSFNFRGTTVKSQMSESTRWRYPLLQTSGCIPVRWSQYAESRKTCLVTVTGWTFFRRQESSKGHFKIRASNTMGYFLEAGPSPVRMSKSIGDVQPPGADPTGGLFERQTEKKPF